MVINKMLKQEGLALKAGKGEFLFGEFSVNDTLLYLIKPLTFMNLSGVAVNEAINYFDVNPNDLIVVLDDANLPFGTIRLRKSGSDGGHKGLASVIYHISSEAFPRLRIGIGNPSGDLPLSEYVLLNFLNEEKKCLPEIIDNSVSCIRTWAKHGIDRAMNLTNKKSQ